jgi:hypothetical protein
MKLIKGGSQALTLLFPWRSLTTQLDGTAAMSKCSKIREAWANGDRIGALWIAARFFDRSADTQIPSPCESNVGAVPVKHGAGLHHRTFVV